MVVRLGFEQEDCFDRYELRDMCVLGDSCYFCGVRTVMIAAPVLNEHGEILSPEVQNYGFVGFFRVSEIRGGYLLFFLKCWTKVTD